MNQTLVVYGFGSFFRGAKKPGDIDLLLIHRSTDQASCLFAVECKRHFQRHLPHVEVVMLSAIEAEQNEFISRAEAIRLATIDSDSSESQVLDLARRIAASGSL
ncbi:hypothetical protein [Brevundimonas naejangsanensis]